MYVSYITSTERKEVILNGWKAAGIYDVVKLGSSKLPNINPLYYIDPFIVENVIPVETNLDDVCHLGQEKLDSHRTKKKQIEMMKT